MGDYVKLYSDYGEKIPGLVGYRNYWGAQFHPEKSSKLGESILKRFLEL